MYEYTNLSKHYPVITYAPGFCLPTHTTISIFVHIRIY
jgi:hypothetical protein